jgi:hypothetical protein
MGIDYDHHCVANGWKTDIAFVAAFPFTSAWETSPHRLGGVMIYKRVAARLGAQDWLAITIELAIVIVGVFIGTQVSNWNAERLNRQDNLRILHNLRPEIADMVANFRAVHSYYDTTNHYAQTAFAGWRRDPKVSDRDFVVGAFQASQIFYTGLNNDTWSQIYGSDRLRTIDSRAMRKDLSVLMTTDYTTMERDLFSDYRRHAREIIPSDVQDAIREQCGDRAIAGAFNSLVLPSTCDLHYPAPRITATATALRARPDLANELNWHLAVVSSYRSNLGVVEDVAKDLLARLGKD